MDKIGSVGSLPNILEPGDPIIMGKTFLDNIRMIIWKYKNRTLFSFNLPSFISDLSFIVVLLKVLWTAEE